MKIAFVTHYDPRFHFIRGDGYGYYSSGLNLARALENQGMEIFRVGPLRDPSRWFRKARKLACQIRSRKTHLYEWEPDLLREYARQVRQAVLKIKPDLILTHNTVAIAHLETDLPRVVWTDSTFAARVDFYPRFKNLCRHSLRHGHEAERLALQKMTLAVYTSEWAAASAVKNYPIRPDRVRVVAHGANFSSGASREAILQGIRDKKLETCRLLFIGFDWARKGAEKAAQIAESMNRLGFQTRLALVGCRPPSGVRLPDCVQTMDAIDRSTPRGKNLLAKLYAESHFLLLPTTADCTPGVIREACSWGVPALCSNVGGIPSLVKHGGSGALFPPEAAAESYAAFAVETMRNPDAYRNLSSSAFSEFELRLNWEAAGRQMTEVLRECSRI